MSLSILCLITVSLLAFVAGQLLIKVAMTDEEENAARGRHLSTRRKITVFTLGIASMTVTFFINLGLLQKLDLSFLFPFQGLCVIVVTLGASYFLKERLTWWLVTGTLLVTAGVILVSAS